MITRPDQFVKAAKKAIEDKKAFSLVEILVVSAIIAVLAGLLISAVGSMANTAKSSKCISNLHQIGIAFHQYISDHNGQIPPNSQRNRNANADGTAGGKQLGGPKLSEALQDYLPFPGYGTNQSYSQAGVYWCPADSDPNKRPVRFADYSYSVNWRVGDNFGLPIMYNSLGQYVPTGTNYAPSHGLLGAMTNASKVIYLIDQAAPAGSGPHSSAFTSTNWPFSKSSTLPAPDYNTLWIVDFRHNNKANALFVDGAVHAMTFSDLAGSQELYTEPLPKH